MTDNAYPEILALELGDDLLNGVDSLVEQVKPYISWRRFGLIPNVECPGSPIRFAIDFFRAAIARRYLHLTPSPAQPYLLRWLLPGRQWQARALFRFLCLNEAIDVSVLESLLGSAAYEAFLSSGIFIKHGDAVRLPVTLIPYRDHYYLGESRHLLQNREAYSITPAHVSLQTPLQIDYYHRLFKGLAPRRILEVGAGIGMVALELRDLCEDREGAEIYQRNLDFAAANAKVRRDTSIRFYQSDLFERVAGTFDIIFFNPWQPTVAHMDLVLRFLEQAPDHLAEGGHIALLIGSWYSNGSDAVMEEVARQLDRQALVATEYIAVSWAATPSEGEVATGHLSFLMIERRRRAGPLGPLGTTIRTKKNLPALVFHAKKARDAFRRRLFAGSSR
jgi:SAM-dependent methyltransferase